MSGGTKCTIRRHKKRTDDGKGDQKQGTLREQKRPIRSSTTGSTFGWGISAEKMLLKNGHGRSLSVPTACGCSINRIFGQWHQ